jgi:restriction system protein
MAIPDYQSLFLPLLRFAGDAKSHTVNDAVTFLSNEFKLSDAERTALLPSGGTTTIKNRVAWARTYLTQSGLLVAPARGIFTISDAGRAFLKKNPTSLRNRDLAQIPAFQDFKKRSRPQGVESARGEDESTEIQTPEEQIGVAYQSFRKTLETELLDQVKRSSPTFFEQLVIDVLVAMGYGGSREDAGRAIGRSGDGGIDGEIKEDRLGLDIIYVQAKRWDAVVGRPEIQTFVGALQGRRANKGIVITTSTFTKTAQDYVDSIQSKIILIDGDTLARYMVDFGVGVSTTVRYELKKLDNDYFDEN